MQSDDALIEALRVFLAALKEAQQSCQRACFGVKVPPAIQSPQVFFSYAWGSRGDKAFEAFQRFLKTMKGHLEQAGITVWMDLFNLVGDLDHGMQAGIARSHLIVLMGTQRYAERTRLHVSSNVQRELRLSVQAASQSSCDVVPLLLEGTYERIFHHPALGYRFLMPNWTRWVNVAQGHYPMREYILDLVRPAASDTEPLGLLAMGLGLHRSDYAQYRTSFRAGYDAAYQNLLQVLHAPIAVVPTVEPAIESTLQARAVYDWRLPAISQSTVPSLVAGQSLLGSQNLSSFFRSDKETTLRTFKEYFESCERAVGKTRDWQSFLRACDRLLLFIQAPDTLKDLSMGHCGAVLRLVAAAWDIFLGYEDVNTAHLSRINLLEVLFRKVSSHQADTLFPILDVLETMAFRAYQNKEFQAAEQLYRHAWYLSVHYCPRRVLNSLLRLGAYQATQGDYKTAAIHYRFAALNHQTGASALSDEPTARLSLLVAQQCYEQLFEGSRPLLDYFVHLMTQEKGSSSFEAIPVWLQHCDAMALVLAHFGYDEEARKFYIELTSLFNGSSEGVNVRLAALPAALQTMFRENRNQGQSAVHGFLNRLERFRTQSLFATIDEQDAVLATVNRQWPMHGSDQALDTVLQCCTQSTEAFLGPAPIPYALVLWGGSARGERRAYARLQYSLLLGAYTPVLASCVEGYFKRFAWMLDLKILGLQSAPEIQALGWAKEAFWAAQGLSEIHTVDELIDHWQSSTQAPAVECLDLKTVLGDHTLVHHYQERLLDIFKEPVNHAIGPDRGLALLKQAMSQPDALDVQQHLSIDYEWFLQYPVTVIKALSMVYQQDCFVDLLSQLSTLKQAAKLDHAAYLGLHTWLALNQDLQTKIRDHGDEVQAITWYTSSPGSYALEALDRQRISALAMHIYRPLLQAIRVFVSSMSESGSVYFGAEAFEGIRFYQVYQEDWVDKDIPVPALLDFLYTYGGRDGERVSHQLAHLDWRWVLHQDILEPYCEDQVSRYQAEGRIQVVYLNAEGRLERGILNQEVARQLLNKDGTFNQSKKGTHGRGLALPIWRASHLRPPSMPPIAYAKPYPEYPFVHLVVQDFAFRCSGFGHVGTLCRFESMRDPKVVYPVFLSSYGGPTLSDALEAGQLDNVEATLDPYALTLKAFESYLMVYGDDKLDNLSTTKRSNSGWALVSIDPDRALGSERQGTQVGLRTAVYCARGMKAPPDRRAIAEWMHLDPYRVLTGWLERSSKWAYVLESGDLFARAQRSAWKREHQCSIEVAFEVGMAGNLYQRWQRLRAVLSADLQPERLVEPLARLMPWLMEAYQSTWSEGTLDQRFNALPTDYQQIEMGRLFLWANTPSHIELFQTPGVIRKVWGQSTDDEYEIVILNARQSVERKPIPESLSRAYLEALFEAPQASICLAWNHALMVGLLKAGHHRDRTLETRQIVQSVTASRGLSRRTDTMGGLFCTPTLVPHRQGMTQAEVGVSASLRELQQVHHLYEERNEHIKRILNDDWSQIEQLKQWPFLVEAVLRSLKWKDYKPEITDPVLRRQAVLGMQGRLLRALRGVPLRELVVDEASLSIQSLCKQVIEGSSELSYLGLTGGALLAHDQLGDQDVGNLLNVGSQLRRFSPRGLPKLSQIEGRWDRLKDLSIGGDFGASQLYFSQRTRILQGTEERLAVRRRAPRPSLLFRRALHQALQIDPNEVRRFLRLVAEGEQQQVEDMLKENQKLAYCSGDVKDLSGRLFRGITGFQYAVWALDYHMWTMLLGYLPREVALEQSYLFETGLWVPKHGVHAGMPGGPLDKLTSALQTYIDNYQAWDWSQCEKHWCRQVGGAQLILPAHVIHEYCRPDRSFVPCPSFTESTLPRTRKCDEGTDVFTAVYNGGTLGVKWGILRYNSHVAWRAVAGERRWRGWDAMVEDHAALVSLTKVRVQQRDQLVSELSVNQQDTAYRRRGP